MRPLLISHSIRGGGAARAAYRLHSALASESVSSSLLVAAPCEDEVGVFSPRTRMHKVLAQTMPYVGALLGRMQGPRSTDIRSLNVVPSLLPGVFKKSRIDLVNLHWVNSEAISISQIGRIDKPTVFTLHDMWAFCGTEHYVEDDERARFRTGYFSRNRPASQRGLDLDRWTWERKKRYWRRPRHVICPSNWLADCARSSALMNEWPVHVIPNPLDTSRFKPYDKEFCRRILGLPAGIPLIGFGAIRGSNDNRKGFDLLIDTLSTLRVRFNSSDVACVVFGQTAPTERPTEDFVFFYLGHIHDEWSLVLLYNAIDVMIVPSRQENLPQTATEAQACGCPVVAFDTTGLADAVVHKSTGYLARPFDTVEMANGISWVLENSARQRELSRSARQRALALWHPSVVVPRYLEVYQAAIRDH